MSKIETASLTKIHFKSEKIKKMYEQNGGIKTPESAGFDLVVVENTLIQQNEVTLLNHGVVIRPTSGMHTEIFPRSSTCSKYNLHLGNSIGLIDRDYSGVDDVIKSAFIWYKKARGIESVESMSADVVQVVLDLNKICYINDSLFIPAGTRLSQLVLRKTENLSFVEFDPANESRGGFGSTGE